MSYSNEKIRKQIAGCKLEMCKNENKIKLINCQALEKACKGTVIMYWKQNLILSGVSFLKFCSMMQLFAKNGLYFFITENFMEIAFFWQMAAA